MTIEENFILKSNPAFKRQYKYLTQKGQSLVIYQTTVVDEKNETMYNLTFTTLEKEFKKSKPLFDKTLNSFDLLK
jgi:hypothetical protein